MPTWLNPNLLLAGLILTLVQAAAALPWIRAIDPRGFDKAARQPETLLSALAGLLAAAVGVAWFLSYKSESAFLPLAGRVYGAILHQQILTDLFLLVPALLTLVLPKSGAVALAAFREGGRQPLFWLIFGFGDLAMWISVVVPYFTFGDDYKMMKQIGFDIIMLCAALFGLLSASMSIAEEIEGRTALTVMSKPVNRRQFLLGKYLGILMACGAMTLLLSVNLNAAMVVMPEFDKINTVSDPMSDEAKALVVPAVASVVPAGPGRVVAGGAGLWFGDTLANLLGIALGFGQVMILVSIATALATRLPFLLNLMFCLMVYFLGNLAPVVVRVTEKTGGQQGTAGGLVQFLSNLFDTLLPALEFFKMGPAIMRDSPLGLAAFAGYVVGVFGYAVLYTTIFVIIGLILFEDRDLA